MCYVKSFVDADARRQLVVPLIYFWCGAIHIDAPLSAPVCGEQATPLLLFAKRRMLSEACHIASPPAVIETCQRLALFFKISTEVIAEVN